ncbi:MAG: hypothetical protein ACRYFZ_19480 [Janthinobacterium lividum]
MSQNLALETEIGRLPQLDQHLVRDCAHQVQQLLDRYNNPHLVSLATELVSAQLQDSLKY